MFVALFFISRTLKFMKIFHFFFFFLESVLVQNRTISIDVFAWRNAG